MVYLRSGRARLPMVPGHEWVARVLDPGAPDDQSVLGSLGSPDVWPQALELLGRGRVRPSTLVTHRYPLEAVDRAVATMRHGADGTGKVLVLPHHQGWNAQQEHQVTTNRSTT
jgi:D-arabinose 1-dehydrogenase-like Zn-dependent alcohol dehydrogenase